MVDPLDGRRKTILWVKGSGATWAASKRVGFATLYLDKVLALERATKGRTRRTKIVAMYRCVRLGIIRWRLPSIRRLHGFLPLRACGPSASGLGYCAGGFGDGLGEMEAFNERFGSQDCVGAVAAAGL